MALVPSEHGAWIMLYGPMAIVMAGVGIPGAILSFLLVVAIFTAFFGQHTAGLLYRGRSVHGAGIWLGLNILLFLTSSSVLVLLYGYLDLVWIGLVALLFLSRQVLKVWRAHKRVDHSVFGEVAAVGAMALTAPAAYLLQAGEVDRIAIAIWSVCLLYFTGSVIYVKMRVSASTLKSTISTSTRWQLGKYLVVYQLCVVLVILLLTEILQGSTLVILGFLPSLVRASWGWATLDSGPISLTRIGIGELCYSVWFGAACVVTLRTVTA